MHTSTLYVYKYVRTCMYIHTYPHSSAETKMVIFNYMLTACMKTKHDHASSAKLGHDFLFSKSSLSDFFNQSPTDWDASCLLAHG